MILINYTDVPEVRDTLSYAGAPTPDTKIRAPFYLPGQHGYSDLHSIHVKTETPAGEEILILCLTDHALSETQREQLQRQAIALTLEHKPKQERDTTALQALVDAVLAQGGTIHITGRTAEDVAQDWCKKIGLILGTVRSIEEAGQISEATGDLISAIAMRAAPLAGLAIQTRMQVAGLIDECVIGGYLRFDYPDEWRGRGGMERYQHRFYPLTDAGRDFLRMMEAEGTKDTT